MIRICVMARSALFSTVVLRFVLLGVCVLWISPADAVCNGTGEGSDLCGHLLYDVNMYTCCNGNIALGSNLACCGTTAYNILESSCCNNNITRGLSQAISYCCESKAYNPLNEICCKGKILKKESSHEACCGPVSYSLKTKLCCNNTRVEKKTDSHVCCGSTTYSKDYQCCCSIDLKVHNITKECCTDGKSTDASRNQNKDNTTSFAAKQTGSQGSAPSETSDCIDSLTEVCCQGKKFRKTSGFTQCCGAKVYDLSEEGVLCCDGQLYQNQPAGSVCAGSGSYSPQNHTVCQKQVHLPAGQHCCGKKPFDPAKQICCNGHSHNRSMENMMCCGSHAYSPGTDTHMCCSGHLYDLSCLVNKREAGCCGPLLLTNKTTQQCCHSAEKTLVYESKLEHSCCGHWYYNWSLWSCCAGQLRPTPIKNTNRVAKDSKPLSDIQSLMYHSNSTICTTPVLLGKVQSVAVKRDHRYVVLENVLEVNTAVIPRKNSLEIGPLDHCLLPDLEIGKIYLWTKINESSYEPLAYVKGLTFPLHTILSLCQSNSKNSNFT